MQTALQCLVVDRAERAISIADAMEFVADDRFGATDLFVGYVRCINQGRSVNGISYDMFDPLVLVKFREAADTAAREAGVACKISVAHAKGRLNVGDVAVVVAVGTGHRAAAFQICRAVIKPSSTMHRSGSRNTTSKVTVFGARAHLCALRTSQ